MAAQSSYDKASAKHPWPLAGYENAPPLSDERTDDGKSFRNPASDSLSKAYDEFPDPLRRDRRGGFDVHVYYFQNNEKQMQFAKALWERIRREFPELRIYRFWDRPIGPHPVAMFEVNLMSPAEFGAFVPWLAMWRGDLSVLVHPNTIEPGVSEAMTELKDHTERALWMGEKIPLDLSIFYKEIEAAHSNEQVSGKIRSML